MNKATPRQPQKLSKIIIRHIVWLGLASFILVFLFTLVILDTSVNTTVSTLARLEHDSVIRQLRSGEEKSYGSNLSVYHNWNALPNIIKNQFSKPELTSQPQEVLITQAHTPKSSDALIYSVQYSFEEGIGEVYLVSAYSEEVYDSLVEKITNDLIINSTIISAVFLLIVWLLISWIYFRTTNPLRELSDWAQSLSSSEDNTREHRFNIIELNDIADKLLLGLASEKKYYDRETMFLKQASHELRSPLFIMQSSLEVLETSVDGKASNFVERALRASKRMSLLVGSLLWLARDSSSPLERQKINVKALIEPLITELSFLKNEKAIELDIDLYEGYIHIQQPLLQMALGNLLRNAFEHSCEGTIHIQSDAHSFKVSNSINNAEAENGSGGFGLGLKLSKRICDKVGWDLQTRTKGDQFVATLYWDRQSIGGKNTP
ncbi:sensor histidine kinase [Pseudoteredinibacter isoporae]|uniref:histidine kinase n=1 Tax=Pseudoteredinibacter isoporae TaxID=570281 RepID=A0A7X0JVX4_9GAMM|nr:HAMP domain-containing sensor histidine kinase [Pseudoteredinibacter isoporae]MBB6522261.1 signal transduction histidine kinase [Pseudoteredinibacter isoporae]NHO87794.1 HAMP domain-containing histidine kinase [Pseudoteredinibacter isoporae]NIB23875.1 HAMP domain-containing histidine kinase [Pseudoteredinibacter isoporae]